MTAADLPFSSSLLSAQGDARVDNDNDNLVQRLEGLTTSSARPEAPAVHVPTKPLTSSPEPVSERGTKSNQFASSQNHPVEQTGGAFEDTSAMGEANSLSRQLSNSSDDGNYSRRPSTPRAQTDPSPEMLPTHHPRPRNRSPYSRSHLRSHSGSSSLSAPPMTRAHSLPTVINPSGHLSLSPSPLPLARPSSPLRSPKRTRSPRGTLLTETRNPQEDLYAHSGAPSVCDISEDAELELTPRAGTTTPLSSLYSSTGSLSRSSRRRPVSPLHQVSVPFGTPTSAPAVSTPTSTTSSPLLSASKFNEPFPGLNYSSSLTSSSVPSTPTSMRSRSPSISSLETIPDSPDAEAEAIEADRIARLKAAADKEKEGTEGVRRSSLDVPGGSGRTLGFGKRDSRKRWSVCGAERRGDLDLETIWED